MFGGAICNCLDQAQVIGVMLLGLGITCLIWAIFKM